MKILLVNESMAGHNFFYTSHILKIDHEFILLTAKAVPEFKCKQIVRQDINFLPRRLCAWLQFIKNIKNIAAQEGVDCIHFMSGAIFYRFFGIGLWQLRKYNPIITFHVILTNFIRNISLKRIFRKIKYGTVHTDVLERDLRNIKINNVFHIEYPDFTKDININTSILPNIDKNTPVIAAIGSTRRDKGLDFLLDALNFVKNDFHLLIAGAAEAFDENFIRDKIINYKDKVTTLLHTLTDRELIECYNATNFIVVPYRKCFNGASGPLTEGVSRGKVIIGPNHGSLADLITQHHLGYTFESESTQDLARIIDVALSQQFVFDDFAKRYRTMLNPDTFVKKYTELYKKAKNT